MAPIALYPATTEREKIHFHQVNRKTGNRIQYKKVDSDTGREVERDNIIKAYEKNKGDYILVQPEELEAVAIESKRTIEIDSLCLAKKLTNYISQTLITLSPMGKLVSRLLRDQRCD